MLSGCKKSINLQDYCYILVDGYNEHAKASWQCDYERLAKDTMKSKSVVDELYNVSLVQSGIIGNLDKSSDISNGDTITLNIEISTELSKKINVNFKGKSIQYKVDNLSLLQELDIYKDIEVIVTGISPKAEIQMKNNSNDEFIKSLRYIASQEMGLKNGDVITIQSNLTQEEANLSGYYLTATEMSYEISGLSEYISDVSQVKGDLQTEIMSHAQDMVDQYLANKSQSARTISGPTLTNVVFKHKKENTDSQNVLLLFYTYHWRFKMGLLDKKEETSYFAIPIYNIYINPDGSFEYDKDNVKTVTSYTGTYEGLYNERVVSQKEKFDITELSADDFLNQK